MKTKKQNKPEYHPLFVDGHIRTHSGIYVNIKNPTEDMIDIEDIAHSLAHQCRFGGHLPKLYSVAQHSVLCANILIEQYDDPEVAFVGLMHDGSEAYLIDMPTPIKDLLPEYKILENNFMKVIAKKFNFQFKKE